MQAFTIWQLSRYEACDRIFAASWISLSLYKDCVLLVARATSSTSFLDTTTLPGMNMLAAGTPFRPGFFHIPQHLSSCGHISPNQSIASSPIEVIVSFALHPLAAVTLRSPTDPWTKVSQWSRYIGTSSAMGYRKCTSTITSRLKLYHGPIWRMYLML